MTVLVLLQHVILPVFFLVLLWRERWNGRKRWAISAFMTTSFVLLVLVIGSWGIAGYALRVALAIALIATLALSWRRLRTAPAGRDRAPVPSRLRNAFDIALGALFFGLVCYALAGYTAGPGVSLDFPLRNGVYIVGHGGSVPLINYHSTHPSQRYALDILKLNAAGFRAWGIQPADREAYAIYGDPVYSPCDGTVVWMRDGLPDLEPGATDPDHPEGNGLAVECEGVVVYLAHMQPGSLRTAEGQPIHTGDLVGLVGNSGNTTEPHLHVHAERGPYAGLDRGGAGVPMRFNGRFLVRNSLVARSAP